METAKIGVIGFVIMSSLMAGCESPRYNANYPLLPPSPLPVTPTDQVQKSALPAPNTPPFPTAPTSTQDTVVNDAPVQLASAPPPTNALDLTAGNVAGVWNASLAGNSCRVATPQTKFGQGYRAGPLRCPGILAKLSSWSVNGKQLVLYDASGGTIAQLYSLGQEHFEGQTSTGQTVSLSR